MPLNEDEIARMAPRGRTPEVIEAYLVERRRGNHGDVCLKPPLERAITRILPLESRRNGIDAGSVRLERQIGACAARVIDETIEQEVCTLGALSLQHRIDG